MENKLTQLIPIVDNVICVVEEMFTKTADKLTAIMDSNAVQDIKVVSDVSSDAVDFIKKVKMICDIPTQIFMYKFERYCKGLSDIPLEKRETYLRKTEKISRKKETLFILNVINKIEEIEKIDITVRLLEAKLDGKIDDTMYRRLIIMVGDTLYRDLLYMNDDINHDNFPIKDDAQEGLLGNGWIRPLGPGWGSFDESESENLFAYNTFAKQLCRLVFGNTIDVIPPSDRGILKASTKEDIDEILSP